MKGKIALVTGGMGGIGTTIAQQLSQRGALVAVTYHRDPSQAASWQEEQKKLGYDFSIIQADITNFDSSVGMVTEVVKKMGKIDILVNNAGIAEDSTLAKMSLEQWIKVINSDLNSLFNVTRNVLPIMIESKYGRIVNISSVNAQKGQFGQTNYTAAKAGVHGFTKSLAYEVAKKGITVNTISPGYVKTGMMDKIAPDILLKIIEQIPVGRLALPAEVASLVSFLVSETSAYITGANFAINGGLHMS
jgi:acetoacetyl-CoA reductase